MYEPELLQTFLAVAQSLSFTRAGASLGVAQSTVSQQVRRLEQAVGRALFVRDTRSVTLTADGEAMAGLRSVDTDRARGGGQLLHRLRTERAAAVRGHRRSRADPRPADPVGLPSAVPASRPRAHRFAKRGAATPRRVGAP
ncbi:LysR family transcriptional regulator [Kribbella sp. NPDC050820]|uniref:helix-turn-helix domain-containing protein n=1 Tax=Kribbella sp. NPDC050820 TaxID=3155408 RepID=UPI0033F921DB